MEKPDFRKIAAKAREDYEKRVAEEERRRTAEKTARGREINTCVAALEKHVIPLLEKARVDFAAEGIECELQREFDVQNRDVSVKPSIGFRCLGPERASDRYRFPVRSAFYASDSKFVELRMGKSEFSKSFYDNDGEDVGREPCEKCEQLVVKGIEMALDAYYQQLRQYPGWINQ